MSTACEEIKSNSLPVESVEKKMEAECKSGALADTDASSDNKEETLQERFMRFKRERARALKAKKARQARQRSDPAHLEKLRKKFVETAMKYQGVPYAQKYHEPGTELYDAPLFLDCCGLVRRTLDDLQEDFGFRIGRWNQAYQFDTLPIALTFEQLQPGDLVFYTGTYFSKRAKQQKHDMVHVEIFVGGETGEATLGARKQKGVCQIFDSYKFESKNYHSIQYHFRSIDTWLRGECKSCCEEHPWEAKGFSNIDSAKSVFAEEEAQSGDVCLEGPESGDEENKAPC